MEDKTFKCVDCPVEFVWTAGEQEFMQQLKDEGKVQTIVTPKRCKECRLKHKEKFL